MVVSDNSPFVIHLLPGSEKYRNLIEKSVSGLSLAMAQAVADEVSGTIRAIELGQRKPVIGFAKWVPALADSARLGGLVQQYGPDVARMRRSSEKYLSREQESANKTYEDTHRLEQDYATAMSAIESLSDADLASAATAAAEKFPFRKMRSGIIDSILSRRIPAGPGRAEAIQVLKDFSGLSGDGS